MPNVVDILFSECLSPDADWEEGRVFRFEGQLFLVTMVNVDSVRSTFRVERVREFSCGQS